MSHQEHFFQEHMPAVFTSSKSTVRLIACEYLSNQSIHVTSFVNVVVINDRTNCHVKELYIGETGVAAAPALWQKF